MIDTKQRILDSAMRLVQSHSYAGFSFQDIADEVGIRKASIYSHFRSKEELAERVLEEARYFFESEISPLTEERVEVQLDSYLGLFRRVFSGGERMCPGGSFAAVWSSVSPSLQAAVQDFTEFHLTLIEGILRRGRDLGSFKANGQTPGQQALLILSNIEGAVLMARITGKSRVLDTAIDQIKAQVLA